MNNLRSPWAPFAVPNDRLKRFCVISTEGPGTGREVIASGIRREDAAKVMAAGPDMLAVLKKTIQWIDDCGAQAGTQTMMDEIQTVIDKAE